MVMRCGGKGKAYRKLFTLTKILKINKLDFLKSEYIYIYRKNSPREISI